MSWTSDVLPLPVPPIMPTVEPDGIFSFMFERASLSTVSEYLKPTASNSISPLSTSFTAFSGLTIVLFSSSTSVILRALSSDIVIIVMTMANIMSENRICIV